MLVWAAVALMRRVSGGEGENTATSVRGVILTTDAVEARDGHGIVFLLLLIGHRIHLGFRMLPESLLKELQGVPVRETNALEEEDELFPCQELNVT